MPDRGSSSPGVASDWLRPRLGRTWRDGVVVGVGPRAAYVQMRVTGQVGEHDRGAGMQVGDTTPPAGPPRDRSGSRGRPPAGDDRPPAACPGSPTTSSAAPAPRVPGASPSDVLAIEGPGAVGLPNGIRVGEASLLARLAVGDRVVVRGSRVQVCDVELVVARWDRSRPVPGAATMATVARRLAGLDDRLAAPTRDADSWLVAGGRDLVAVAAGRFDGSPATVVDRLLGRGPGSTPAGDDLLAGFLATMVVLARAVGRTADLDRLNPVGDRVRDRVDTHTTPLSATLLRCALDGAMARPAADLVRALTARDGPDGLARTRTAVTALARVGHTSGRDLATGILAALHHLVATAPGHAAGAPARPPITLQSLGSS